jgi:hypothetical protein
MAVNWANKGKEAAKAVPLTVTKSGKEKGTRHKGFVESFTPKSYKTGSFGVEIKYTVEGIERPVYENLVLTTLSKTGTMEPTKYGESSLKRRLQAFGLDSEAINLFPIPRSPKDGDNEAYSFTGTPVTVYIRQEEYMGKTQNRVNAVFPADQA